MSLVPYVARLAEEAGLEHRIIERDRYPHVIEAHLTRGSRSIRLSSCSTATSASWGPRPTALQNWFFETGKAMPPTDRYREIRRWYASDRGQTTIEEIVSMIERTAGTREAAA